MAKSESLRFVVHEHQASTHHWDFRLQVGPVLKSWAVPKGPTLDPAVKRLAVAVADHPLQYGDWEGIIPPGRYGSGPVLIWDTGRFSPLGDPLEAYRKGRLTFTLAGKRLQGEFSLVRMARGGEKNWLLIKARDEKAISGWEPPSDLTPEKLSSLREGEPPCAVD